MRPQPFWHEVFYPSCRWGTVSTLPHPQTTLARAGTEGFNASLGSTFSSGTPSKDSYSIELPNRQRGAHILGISPLLLSRFASSSSVEMTGLGSFLRTLVSRDEGRHKFDFES